MKEVRRLVCWVCIPAVVVVVLMISSSQLHDAVEAHVKAPYALPLLLLFGIGAPFTAMLAAFLIEWLVTGWSGSSLQALCKARASVRLDVLSTLVMRLPHKYLDYFLSLGLLYFIATEFKTPSDISVAHWLPSWGLQAGLALILSSLVSYWIHRIQHTIPALWALHKFHHSADRLAILTTFRDTKLSIGLDAALRVLPLALLSAPVAPKPTVPHPEFLLLGVYFLFTALTRLNSFVIHSNLDVGYGWVGRWLLVSPRMHRIHHSTQPAHHNRNFSFDFVLWDRLFGTYHEFDAAAQVPVGLVDNPFDSGESLMAMLRDYFVTPYTEFWREIRRGRSAWLPARRRRDAAAHVEPAETLKPARLDSPP